MQKLRNISVLLLANLLIVGCTRSQVQDSLASAVDDTLRNSCERAGNCEVYCKSDRTIKTPDGRCVGE